MTEKPDVPSFYSDPQVQFLSNILEELKVGHIQIPRFQRPLIWDWDKRLELFRSIKDGIPFGAIMLWRTNEASVACFERIGLFRIPAPRLGSPRQYLLDGVQRLTTLFSALIAPSAEAVLPDDESKVYEVYYDFVGDDFVTSEDGVNLDGMLPLKIVFNSVELIKFQRTISGPDASDKVSRVDEIARAFRDYKIALIPITTNSLELATRTFQKINTQGAIMSEMHMIHALTWSSDFELRSHLASLKSELLDPIGWGDLDEDWLLKAVKTGFDIDVYEPKPEQLSRAIREDRQRIKTVVQAVARAAVFLRDHCYVVNPDFLPYGWQLVLMAEAVRAGADMSGSIKPKLVAWFWLTTYSQFFRGLSGNRMNEAIRRVREMVDTGKVVWPGFKPFSYEPLPANWDFRSARARAMAIAVAKFLDTKFNNTVRYQTLTEKGRDAIHTVLTQPTTGMANRIICKPDEIARIRTAVEWENDIDLSQYFIENEDVFAYRNNGPTAFVEARYRRLVRLEIEISDQAKENFFG